MLRKNGWKAYVGKVICGIISGMQEYLIAY
jgi:hypothetical protein